ncbi:MAG: ABC transporter permease, partial [Candidatus Eisenbacteria bacterium]
MAIPFVYNLRNVAQRPVSTGTTAIGIGLTVAVLLAAMALAEGFHATQGSTGSTANAMVLRKGADNEISSGIALDAADILKGEPWVAPGPDGRPLASLEMLTTTNLTRVGQTGSSNIRVRGVDLASIGVRAQPKIVEGRMFTPGTDEVVVGATIAPRFSDCRVGDVIRFQRRGFRVVGHFTTGGSSFESEIWGDAAVLMPVFHREGGYQVAVLRMRDPARFEAIKKEVEGDPRLGVQVQRESEFYAEQSRALTTLIRGIGIFITLIMAVGALFGAANTMFAAVSGRTREIATLLVLGFSPWAVMVSFMVESMLIALAGGVLGCLIALPINGITTSTTNFQSFSEVAFRFRVTPALMLAALIFSAGLGLAGGLVPALKASR